MYKVSVGDVMIAVFTFIDSKDARVRNSMIIAKNNSQAQRVKTDETN